MNAFFSAFGAIRKENSVTTAQKPMNNSESVMMMSFVLF